MLPVPRPAAAARARHPLLRLGFLILLLSPVYVWAVESEIHVYDDSIATPGSLNLTVHNNYIASGERSSQYAGAVVPDGSLTGGTEWTYGALPWLECGIYLPILTHVRGGGVVFDGAELRTLLVSPGTSDGQRFFYGINMALDINNRALSEHRMSGEFRPLLGAHWGALTLSFNPSLLTGFDGVSGLEFAPSERVSYELSRPWTFALEHYSELGPMSHLHSLSSTQQELFAVAQHNFDTIVVEAGAGWGVTHASDHLTLKLVVSFDLP